MKSVLCWGCRNKLTDGAWFFTNESVKKLALCEGCHRDSAPTKDTREWRVLNQAPRFIGGGAGGSALVNNKPLD